MKKICLLFVCAGLITFTANAQEGKKTQQPVKVTPVERPAPVAKPAPAHQQERVSIAETTPKTNTQAEAKPVAKAVPAKRQPVKYKRVNAVAVPVAKAGAAK